MMRRLTSMMAPFVLVGLVGCAYGMMGGGIKVTKPFRAKVFAKAPADVHVDVGVGDLKIKPGPADSTEVSVTGTLGGEDQEALDAVIVTVVRDSGGITTVMAKGPNGKNWKADLTILVPTKTSLTVKSGVGNVEVSGLEGTMNAEIGVGNVTGETLALTGDSRFQSGTGNVTLGLTSWLKDSTLKVESGVGTVTVRVPSSLGMTVAASAGVGNLSTSGLKFQGNPRTKSVVGGELKGRTSSEPEGRTLNITSGTGNVTIEGVSAK